MKQEEVEVEETTVDRFYCDECGTECTDDLHVEPKDVCSSCSSETAIGSYKERHSEKLRGPDEDQLGIGEAMFLFIAGPLVLLICAFDLLFGDSDKEMCQAMKEVIVFITSGAVYTGFIVFLIML